MLLNNKKLLRSFPKLIDGPVYLNGYNAVSSYGSSSYFIHCPDGNWMIDSPRFDPALVEQFHLWGGLRRIFLTHRDDVADADRYARAFGAERIIHEADLSAQPDAEIVLSGSEETDFGQARIIPTPGHTSGHGALLWDETYLFTGDHLFWSSEAEAFRASREYCWYSWRKQIGSVEKLARCANVAWVLPGHGMRKEIKRGEFPNYIQETVEWMKSKI